MNAPGEHGLQELLRSANPSLDPQEFVFCTLRENNLPQGVRPQCLFREREGVTLVLVRSDAQRLGLSYTFPSRMITLNVHSALDAVGFLSTVMNRLAANGISTNAVSAFYHDHLFVPLERAEEALETLRQLGS